MFILTAQRENNRDYFERYQAYLTQQRNAFPKNAFELATSSWYWNFNDPKCPHDAWLEKLFIVDSNGNLSIHVTLLGAYHDGYIDLTYSNVHSYNLSRSSSSITAGTHGDWRYDEFRISESGYLLHEIEWWTLDQTGSWLIEADDITFSWRPISEAPNRKGEYQLR